ncbi:MULTISPECIES: hypothetical protein [unclassified Roseovarius]|uniref:hypothetical protein n=1 Tax=unclassified Roseovarius TaxID=2614913 RepID=UPI00273FC8EA|nr:MULTISPECIES: hypothetical protein [unclassified Roseovarius]
MKTCILRGVPSSLRQDGWWLGPITPARVPPHPPHAAQNPRRYALHALLLGGLIALSQGPWAAAPDTADVPLACGNLGDLGFRAAHDLRSLAPSAEQGTPL